jgi:hypothetical protein
LIPAEFSSIDLIAHLQGRLQRRPLASYFSNVLQQLRHDEDLYSLQVERSDKATSGVLCVYDQWVALGPIPEWNIDITGSRVWPKLFFKRYRGLFRRKGNEYGDLRFTWELNRQQHLIGLALAYNLSSDARYADTVLHHIVTWIDENPPFHSLNWMSSMEVSLRLITWCLSLAQLNAVNITRADKDKILFSLYQQMRFLGETLSVDLRDAGSDTKLKNNHTIVELAGLIIALEFFPMLAEGIRARSDLMGALISELERQTYPDGMHVEQASSYLRFVVEGILVVRLMLPDSQGLDKYIDRYMHALSTFQCSKDSIFVIGDEDNGHVLIPCYESRPESLQVALDLYEVLLHQRGSSAESESHSDRNWHLVSGHTSSLQDSGHWCLRRWIGEQNIALYFRAGKMDFPLIPGYAPHAHCDLLSFVFAINGEPWLVDRGTYSYKVREISDELRYSKAHNTIIVDGFEQMRILGPFHNDRHASGMLLQVGDEHVKGEMLLSDGERVVKVTREIRFNSDSSEIVFHDVVSGLIGERVTWVLNLHPDVELFEEDLLKRKRSCQILRLDGFQDLGLHAVDYSSRYGLLEKSTQLTMSVDKSVAGTIEKKWSIEVVQTGC